MDAVDLHLVLAFVAATALLSLVPGPDLLFIVANGAAGGRRAGVVAALGVSTGLAVHTVAAALGLGLLIRSAPDALQVVRIAGGIVLLYLAVSTWLASRRAGELTAVRLPRRSLRRTYVLAALTNLANPKVILFFLAFVPQFVTAGPGAAPVAAQLLLLGLIFILVGLSVDGPAGLLSGTLSERITGRTRARAWMERLTAGVFAGLAVRLLSESQ